MCTYLKNMEGYKLKDLKLKGFDAIQEMFDKSFKRVNTFEDFRTELVEGKEKRAKKELIQENEEEVTIDAIPLAVKSPRIVDWKIHKEGKKSYYQIIRADGKSQMYMVFSHMLKSFDREDLEDLYKLVKARYGSTRPVESMDYLLWNDMKIMFEPHVEDASMQIYMLVEKKYPLTPPTLSMMLEKKLQIDYESEMAYQLCKLIIKQLKNLFDAVRITAAQVYVNIALMKLVLLMNFKENILIIMEYLVNISERRAFWSINEDILKITILTTNTSYPSRKIRCIRACTHQKTTKETSSIRQNDNEKVNLPSLPSPEPAISCFDDLDFFKDIENKFPAIVYNDAQTSKSDLQTELILSPHHIDEFDLNDETSLSECDEEEQNVSNFKDLFPFNVIYPNDSKSDKDNDDDKVDIEHSSGDLSLKPLPDVINTDV
ncbi:hypothetical protein Tco_0271071 [Tanacetum coccineum]